MYGLPVDVGLSFFIGETAIQVCVGENEFILNLTGPIETMVTSEILLIVPGREPVMTENSVEAGHALTQLLGSVVIAAAGQPDGTTTLHFDNGAILEIRDSAEGYESYTIRYAEGIIVV